MPTFTAPTKPGDYRIRFKIDWNSIDAGGQIAADGTCTGHNGILNTGGTIVDATLRVTNGSDISSPDPNPQSTTLYDLQGRKQKVADKGIYIRNNKKFVIK